MNGTTIHKAGNYSVVRTGPRQYRVISPTRMLGHYTSATDAIRDCNALAQRDRDKTTNQ